MYCFCMACTVYNFDYKLKCQYTVSCNMCECHNINEQQTRFNTAFHIIALLQRLFLDAIVVHCLHHSGCDLLLKKLPQCL